MLNLRVIEKFITKEATKVGLAQLVTATGGASAEFHATLCHGFHTAVAEGVIGFAQDESEGVVAASFKCEVGKIFFAVQLVEEAAQICCADCVVGVETGELGTTEDCVDLGASHVVSRKGKNERWVEIGMPFCVAGTKCFVAGLAHHAMGACDPAEFIEIGIVRAHHAAFDRAQVVCVVE